MYREVVHNGQLLAIIITHDFHKLGTTFFTPGHFSQQLGFIHHSQGHVIKAHSHHEVSREVTFTQEVLFIRKGKLQVDLFDSQKQLIKREILTAGDVILLASGGHGFKVLEELEMIEVKQGPYLGDMDKYFLNP